MPTEQEILRDQLIQEMLMSKDKNVQLIENRDSQLSSSNLSRSVRSLVEIYGDGASLKKKAADFSLKFETTIFAGFIHQTAEDLGEKVRLESARKALEQGSERSSNTTHLDMLIGNDRYVFASSRFSMPGAGYFAGRNAQQYEISGQADGWAASADILDIPSLAATNYNNRKEVEAEMIYLSAKNLFTIPDFKLFFSAYCATFFTTPEEAELFFTTYSKVVGNHLRNWHIDPTLENEVAEADQVTMTRMRDLFVRKNVVPPFKPEFQFRDEVEAILVSD